MKTGTLLATILLTLVAIAHLSRALLEVPFIVGKYQVPIWMSWIAVLLTLSLSISIWYEHRKTK